METRALAMLLLVVAAPMTVGRVLAADAWILSGLEHGRSVSMVITAEGRMTLSVVADGVVWSVFGHALPEGEAAQPAEAKAEEAVAEPAS